MDRRTSDSAWRDNWPRVVATSRPGDRLTYDRDGLPVECVVLKVGGNTITVEFGSGETLWLTSREAPRVRKMRSGQVPGGSSKEGG